ncbi:MAG: EAL domain-containing protein [Sphingomonas ginsenosidimutans]|jgi:diguanylate cyclase|uniref:EAL domain-containing protein n=1 Tax=Sphingomonas ginsenosidimutans TaxID=862134 RepID=A0A2A4HXM0_9SPHN|nr:EAL domain-containing protein [Sphingomonas ginsenosidimutans]PCG08753.1 hypothetical protein COA17_11430 [Sphingomonas ginsenosidimutans]
MASPHRLIPPASPAGPPAGSAREGGVPHVKILAEIENFAALRRSVGVARSRALATDLADRIAALLPGSAACAIAPATIEIDAHGTEADVVGAVTRAMAAPMLVGDDWCHIDSSFGVAIAAAGVDDEMALIERAEQSLAQARRRRSEQDRDDAEQASITALAQELDHALERDELLLMYQPKVHARRHDISSVEALVRWQHPERGMVMPSDFIAAAEEVQRIDGLTIWTIRRALRDQMTLRAAGYDLRIFINISGQLLSDAHFVETVCAIVEANPDAKLGFEVTETSVIRDPECAIANLNRFDAIGVRISIDDYGAGLSSLAYLKQLPARELKIDKLFITHLTSSNRDPLIVRSTIDLAHALDMEVVAEGVETGATLALLTVMGCDTVQGFFISRPIVLDALIDFLRHDDTQRATRESRVSVKRLANSWKRH